MERTGRRQTEGALQLTRTLEGPSRHGFGASTAPSHSSASYALSALGTDILRVLDHLGTPRAAFAGHSFAGEELTWLALEHPESVAALVYLDAAYDRAAHGKDFAGASRPEPPTTPADFRERPRLCRAPLAHHGDAGAPRRDPGHLPA